MANNLTGSSMCPPLKPGERRTPTGGAPFLDVWKGTAFEAVSRINTPAPAVPANGNYALPSDGEGVVRDSDGAITFSLTRYLSGTGKALYDKLSPYTKGGKSQDLELKTAIENGLSAVGVYRQKYGITGSGTENAQAEAAVSSGTWYLKNVATNPASPINIGKAGIGSVTGIINDIKVSTAAMQAGGQYRNQVAIPDPQGTGLIDGGNGYGTNPSASVAAPGGEGAPLDDVPTTTDTGGNTLSKITAMISENSLVVAVLIVVLFLVLVTGAGLGGRSHGV